MSLFQNLDAQAIFCTVTYKPHVSDGNFGDICGTESEINIVVAAVEAPVLYAEL